MTLGSNEIYGGVTGTVLASAILAVAPSNGENAVHTLQWLLLTAVVTAATRSYGLHVSTHQGGDVSRFWKDLGRSMLLGWPMVAACLPTAALLVIALATGWADAGPRGYTLAGLLLNAVLLFGWGLLGASVAGYSTSWKLLVGSTNSLLGLVFVLPNVAIR